MLVPVNTTTCNHTRTHWCTGEAAGRCTARTRTTGDDRFGGKQVAWCRSHAVQYVHGLPECDCISGQYDIRTTFLTARGAMLPSVITNGW
jgi:hypothetical protein